MLSSASMPRLCSVLYLYLSLSMLLPARALAQAIPTDVTPLAMIQGAGKSSPLEEQEVTTWGLVTGMTSDGFYLQDPVGDGDPMTSDGIFVYTHDAPPVASGECVR